jgi:hypothetical protein
MTVRNLRRAVQLAACAALAIIAVACGSGGGTPNNSNGTGSTVAQQIAACNTSAGYPNIAVPTSGNSVPIILDSGPCAYGVVPGSAAGTASSAFIIGAANVPYTSVTICNPGTTTCQTIDHILVDTGSSGLRVMSSVLNTNIVLPAIKVGTAPLVECLQFADGYSWGSVRTADVHLAGEVASSIPVQVIGDSGTAPQACINSFLPATASALNDVISFGANGVLGVGLFREDCGSGCVNSSLNTFYFTCPTATSCTGSTAALNQQVANPVAKFLVDNNGVILVLPQVAAGGGAQNLQGTLVFGVSTSTNNALTTAQAIYQANPTTGNFISTLTGFDASTPTAYTVNSTQCPNSFIDSGSNAIYLPNQSNSSQTTNPIPVDSSLGGWFAPTTPRTLVIDATIQDYTAIPAATPVTFTIANASDLFGLNGGVDTAFNGLGAPSGNCSTNTGGVDWGMPFFFNKSLYTVVEGATPTVNGGSAPQGPFWAF